MKILVLNGSPRAKGNTAAMAEAFKKGAEKNGHEVDVVRVASMNIKPCIACEYCHTKGAGTCVQKDDMQNLYPVIAEADMIVFASPVYYFGFSGQLQSALSRFYPTMTPAKAKKFALILSSGSPNVYAGVEAQYKGMLAYFGGQDLGIRTAHGAQNGTPEVLAELEAFGESIK